MFKKIKNYPVDLPFPLVNFKEINNGKLNEVLDVRIHTISIPQEDVEDTDKWLFPLFKRVESIFLPKMGKIWTEKVALTAPLIREIRGDYKDKKLLVTLIAVDATPIIKREGIND